MSPRRRSSPLGKEPSLLTKGHEHTVVMALSLPVDFLMGMDRDYPGLGVDEDT